MFRSFGYKLFASDGTRNSGTGAGEFIDFDDLVWEEIAELEENPAPERFIFEEHLPPRKVRYLFWSNRNQRRTGVSTVREIQAFGEGFIPGVTLTSGLIDLGGAKNSDGHPLERERRRRPLDWRCARARATS